MAAIGKPKWTRLHEERRERILAIMSRDARAFPDMSAEAVDARRRLPFALWCHKYLPHWFTSEDAPGHAEADARRNTVGTIIAEDWAREMAKTTRYSIADLLFDICNDTHVVQLASGDWVLLTQWERESRDDIRESQPLDFILMLAKTHDKAAERMDLVRLELRRNERLRGDYGAKLEPQLGSDAEDNWTANGVLVKGFGTGESLRSELHNGHRPQKAVADDLENNIIARNPDREKALRDWILNDVYPALEGGGARAVFRLLLNHWGRHCLAAYMRERAEERVDGKAIILYHRYPRRDEYGHSTWRARHTDAATRRLAAIIGPARARTELDCLDSDEEATYHPEWFKVYHLDRLAAARLAAMRKVFWLDPSYTAKETADFKALVGIGRERRIADTFCLHAWLRHCPPELAVDEICACFAVYPDAKFYIEDNGGVQDTYRILFAAKARKGIAVPFIHYDTTKTPKEIEKWQGEISQGLAWFDPGQGDQGVLINQFCDWPKGHDDGPDAWTKARKKLGNAMGGEDDFTFAFPRANFDCLTGGRRRYVPLPGSDEERRELDGLSRFDRAAILNGGIVL